MFDDWLRETALLEAEQQKIETYKKVSWKWFAVIWLRTLLVNLGFSTLIVQRQCYPVISEFLINSRITQ